MALADEVRQNKAELGAAMGMPGFTAPRGARMVGGRGFNPRYPAPMGARALVQGATGGVAPAAPPGGFSVATPASSSPGANLAPAAPATAPDFTPIRTSQGGSMVLGKDNLGVEEIRGTGHPSAQIYQGAGMGEAYPGAVAAWRSGLAREQGETERERMRSATQVEAATIGATKEGPGATLARQAQADLYHAQKAELDRQTKAREAGERGTAFDNYYKATYGGSLPKEGEPAHLAWADARLWEQEHPGEGKRRYQENTQIQEYEKLASPGNVAAAQQAYPNVKIPTPEHWAVLKQNPEIYRQAMLKFGPYLQGATQAPAGAPAGPGWAEAGITPTPAAPRGSALTAPFTPGTGTLGP